SVVGYRSRYGRIISIATPSLLVGSTTTGQDPRHRSGEAKLSRLWNLRMTRGRRGRGACPRVGTVGEAVRGRTIAGGAREDRPRGPSAVPAPKVRRGKFGVLGPVGAGPRRRPPDEERSVPA